MTQPTSQRSFRTPLLLLTLLALLLAAVPPGRAAGTALSQTPVEGDITVNTTWTSAASPYIVTGPVRVRPGATLTVEPGVEVRFNPGALLRVEGGLVARGTHAEQIRMVGNGQARWIGVVLVEPAGGAELRSVTFRNAEAGVSLVPGGRSGGPVEIADSLFEANSVGILVGALRPNRAGAVAIRNNLVTGNGVGLLLAGGSGDEDDRLQPTDDDDDEQPPLKIKLNRNSFEGNGLGVQLSRASALQLKQHWWGSASGPQASCDRLEVPRTDPRDRVCGLDQRSYAPWSDRPAGRARLPARAAGQIESALGAGLENSDQGAPTSVISVSVPANTFAEPVDIIVSGRAPAELPGNKPGPPTSLFFEITAVADGREIERLSGGAPIRIEVTYRPEDLNGVDPATLRLAYFDEQRQVWSFAGVQTTPDPANGRVVALVDHLSRWGFTSTDSYRVSLPLVVQ